MFYLHGDICRTNKDDKILEEEEYIFNILLHISKTRDLLDVPGKTELRTFRPSPSVPLYLSIWFVNNLYAPFTRLYDRDHYPNGFRTVQCNIVSFFPTQTHRIHCHGCCVLN